MELAILLSLAASFCTASASICQRLGARNLERSGFRPRGLDVWLVFRLARQPVWLLGFAAMVLGFLLQLGALHFGPLALVQPILAVELLFVFGYLTVLTRFSGLGWRDWLAAAAMSVGVSLFLGAALPSGGRLHASAWAWWLAGLTCLAAVLLTIAASGGGSRSRRSAFLGVATGIGWGFVAAVVKELSSHVGGGPAALFTNWSVYVLMLAGSATMLLASHAVAAGPLAAAQPGFTIVDPVTGVLLGVFLFGEHVRTAPGALAAELVGLVVLAAGSWALSRSDLITAAGGTDRPGGQAGGKDRGGY